MMTLVGYSLGEKSGDTLLNSRSQALIKYGVPRILEFRINWENVERALEEVSFVADDT
jgi:hypothetical protein